ncbi:PLD nuclease N-terminal domain-containing protein [Agrilactobacillus yilanensis]|uniref:PLD nuclease N-terminal domain-containing protein n=1 Tax=Agrilactobacillus yilanensis TaxID=2485997 RepID=A0ABW4J8Z8_9LACO|nr:PLD nuclease N-terminal domain-containing protein [Agrilactobacillus yilanensis]
MNNAQLLLDNLPLLIPLVILEFGLMIAAVVHVLKHPQYRFGNKVLWLVIVIFFQIIGPVFYFMFGRGETA